MRWAVLAALVAALAAAALFHFVRGWHPTPAALVGAAVALFVYYLLRAVRILGPMYRRRGKDEAQR